MKNALIIFVRNPVKGVVKTRLAATVGEERALEIYIELLQLTAEICSRVHHFTDLHIFYSDYIEQADVWNGIPCKKHLQSNDENLGNRMKSAFSELFGSGYEKVVIIGSDCPYLSPDLLCTAFNTLNDNAVVTGPAKDGGFYLLGVRNSANLAFENIRWSSADVYATLISNLSKLTISPFALPILEDIDDEMTYNRFLITLKGLNYKSL